MSRRYPEELKEYLNAYIPGHTARECSAEIKRVFDYDITPEQIKSYKCNVGIKSGTKGGGSLRVYTQEIHDYIVANHKGVGPDEMCRRVNELFGTNYHKGQIHSFYNARHLNSGVTGRFEKGHPSHNKGRKGWSAPGTEATRFKAGHIPVNKRAIGTVTKRSDGYLWKKTGPGPYDWRQLHLLVWEENNGPIPDGLFITFLDGNQENCSLDNLIAIEPSTHAQLNKHHLRSSDPELTKAGVNLIKLKKAVKERKG